MARRASAPGAARTAAVDSVDRLKALLVKHGWDSSSAHKQCKQLRDVRAGLVKALSENDPLEEMVALHASLEVVEDLRASLRIQDETKNVAFEWTLAHEYDTFNVTNNAAVSEISFWAQLRQGYRDAAARVLAGLGLAPSAFAAAMEVAARVRAVAPDPLFPPSLPVAASVHHWLYGSLQDFAVADYGVTEETFMDEQEQRKWAAHLLRYRRQVVHQLLFYLARSRVEVLPAVRLVVVTGGPGNVLPAWDISGTWLAESSPPPFQATCSAFVALTGRSMPRAIRSFLGQLWAQVDCACSVDAVVLSTTRILSVMELVSIPIDGRAARSRPPELLDRLLPDTGAAMGDLLTRGALGRLPDGTPAIFSVSVGEVVPAPSDMAALGATARTDNDPALCAVRGHADVLTFLADERRKLGLASANVALGIALTRLLLRDGDDHLVVRERAFLLPAARQQDWPFNDRRPAVGPANLWSNPIWAAQQGVDECPGALGLFDCSTRLRRRPARVPL